MRGVVNVWGRGFQFCSRAQSTIGFSTSLLQILNTPLPRDITYTYLPVKCSPFCLIGLLGTESKLRCDLFLAVGWSASRLLCFNEALSLFSELDCWVSDWVPPPNFNESFSLSVEPDRLLSDGASPPSSLSDWASPSPWLKKSNY
jgi:hypothetical protein